MKLYRSSNDIIIEHEGKHYLAQTRDWDHLVNQKNLYKMLQEELNPWNEVNWEAKDLKAPIGTQEIWAAGVTYLRSREARMEESKESGAAVFYSKVYDAERPELFFKSTHYRVAHPGGQVNIRKDSKWNVPEPELTLFINKDKEIVGYTIGNDMSSRDIEGENPLYLPQAKCYDYSAAIGPCLWIPEKPIDPDTKIHMQIERNWKTVFEGQISINQMKRGHGELVEFLTREMSFPNGVYLMTGTCLVPDDTFTLQPDDLVHIEIDGIGKLTNKVAIG
ncbi:fumarylacetoacetate hydrolase family protein [Cecembia calidifontis]|uniref:2-dehydro-3-deoxy-D-arabinonate dehydratase n=1 Tax=Cecembia calidifontis TaxID=1187080 RepID=A0A4Q7PEL5_9BACT|nr:fumarylacetoacetate hydrolase family protein [Cecembia calidifontis]RZS97292.1 2-dehydro-3-deoxy-D-arabinonate dehydratase [Cecembia calidifontis]